MGLLMLNGNAYTGFTEPAEIYSTEEREVGVWTDGKPLYQKTVSFSKDSSWTTGLKSISHGVSNVDYIFIENATAIANNTEIRDLPNVYPTNITAAGLLIYTLNSTDITFYFTNWVGTLDTLVVNVTLRYTKTTDTPGSGKWSPTGLPAKHYSTEEKVIGTWIDGKPIYEKILSYTASLSSSGIASFSHNIANIDTIINIDGFAKTASGTSIPINNGRTGNLMGAWAGKTEVGLYIGNNDCYTATFKIILQYTKTTD